MLDWFAQASICQPANSSIIFALIEFEKATWKALKSQGFLETEWEDHDVCPKYIDVLKSPFCRSSPLCIPKVLRTPRPPLLGSCSGSTRSLGSQETEAAADLYINAWAWGFNGVNKRFEHVALRRCCGGRAAPIPSRCSMACFSRHSLVGREAISFSAVKLVSPANSTIPKLTLQ